MTKPASTEEEHAMLYEARELATKLVGGDPTNIPTSHPIRLPGSWHRKKAPRLAKIVAIDDEAEIDLGEALEILRKAAGVTEPRGRGGGGVRARGSVPLVVALLAPDGGDDVEILTTTVAIVPRVLH